MTELQRKILISCAIAVALMIFFPPFHLLYPNGMEVNLGYGFIFNPPKWGNDSDAPEGGVNILLLLTQWFAVILIGAIAYLLAKDKS